MTDTLQQAIERIDHLHPVSTPSCLHSFHDALHSTYRSSMPLQPSNRPTRGCDSKPFGMTWKRLVMQRQTLEHSSTPIATHDCDQLKSCQMDTRDASVWLREATPSDPDYHVGHALLAALRQQQITLYEPWRLLAEVAGPVGRLLRDPLRGRVSADIVRSFPHTSFVDVDEMIGRAAAELAADRCIRGADAVYPIIAQRYGCALVSLDAEHHRCLPGYISVLTPAEALQQLSP